MCIQPKNEFDQPIGRSVIDWSPPPIPAREVIEGKHCILEPLNAEQHAEELYAANTRAVDSRSWTYLPYGPFDSLTSYRSWVESVTDCDDPRFFAVVSRATRQPQGVASFLRISPNNGSIEVGHIHFSELLKRSRASTEAIYLMMRTAFALGYRRFEWKCDALNAASRVAAQRLGMSFEGIFRQATVYKGRNRDTAWYAVINSEWTDVQTAIETWLDPANFDPGGKQHQRLSQLTRPILVATDP